MTDADKNCTLARESDEHNSALSAFAPSKASHKRRRSCTLMITRRCNLNCSYCYDSSRSSYHLLLYLSPYGKCSYYGALY